MSTDTSGRRARWTAVVVLAPSAAAIFGAMTAWAVRTPVAAASPTPRAKTAATADPALLNARAAADRSARQLAALQRQVTQLRTRLRQVQTAAAASTGTTDQALTSVPTANTQTSAYVPVNPVGASTAHASTAVSTYVAPAPVRTTAAPATATSAAPPPQTTSAAPPPPVQTTSSGSRP